MPISDPPPGMMKSNPDAGTMSLSGTMNKAICRQGARGRGGGGGGAVHSIANTGEIEVRVRARPRGGQTRRRRRHQGRRGSRWARGEEPAGCRSLRGKIDPDESHWQLDEGGTVPVATLAKRTAEKWDALLIQETALR